MKTCAKSLLVSGLLAGSVWAAGSYTIEYAIIDLSGGAVTGVAAPSEDILTAELQGTSVQSSAAYNITSLLRWPSIARGQSAAKNWAFYQ
ncbi:hypothetical protein LLG95_08500 [bacterium]|nr:hypothetical protein [bacterium]